MTDAIRILLERGEKILGVKLGPNEHRYNIGNFESYFRAFVDFALRDEELSPGLLEYLKGHLR